jgi:hypothetical protein
MGWDVKIDNNINVWNIKTSGRHIRRYQDRTILGLELIQGSQPLVPMGIQHNTKNKTNKGKHVVNLL